MAKHWRLVLLLLLVMWSCSQRALANRLFTAPAHQTVSNTITQKEIPEKNLQNVLTARLRSFFDPGNLPNTRVWPDMEFGWRVVLGSIIGFLGAALGSIGGVGGGGIFVPMLTLIIGFDPKTSTAISKCMIMGAAGSTVYYNLRLRHPSLDLPIIDYDLALLFQPMLMLGISIGVAFNVIFPAWMVTVLLIILFLGTSTKALFKGIETWKKESIMKKEVAKLLAAQAMNGLLREKLVRFSSSSNASSSSSIFQLGSRKFSNQQVESLQLSWPFQNCLRIPSS